MIKTWPAAAYCAGGAGMATALDMYRFPHHGEFNEKCSALAILALHPDLAGVLLDDSVSYGQAQAGAAALAFARRRFRCEKWIVNSRQVLGCNTAAGVADRDVDAAPIAGAHRRCAAAR